MKRRARGGMSTTTYDYDRIYLLQHILDTVATLLEFFSSFERSVHERCINFVPPHTVSCDNFHYRDKIPLLTNLEIGLQLKIERSLRTKLKVVCSEQVFSRFLYERFFDSLKKITNRLKLDKKLEK